jgi:hypothetical protein
MCFNVFGDSIEPLLPQAGRSFSGLATSRTPTEANETGSEREPDAVRKDWREDISIVIQACQRQHQLFNGRIRDMLRTKQCEIRAWRCPIGIFIAFGHQRLRKASHVKTPSAPTPSQSQHLKITSSEPQNSTATVASVTGTTGGNR